MVNYIFNGGINLYITRIQLFKSIFAMLLSPDPTPSTCCIGSGVRSTQQNSCVTELAPKLLEELREVRI